MIFYTKKPRKKNPKTGVALFVADLIAKLDEAGLPVYGKAGRHDSNPRRQVVCLDYLGRLNKIYFTDYGPEQYGLTRIHFNGITSRFDVRVLADLSPAKSKQAHTFAQGPSLEITLLHVHLSDMLPTVAGLLTGKVLNTGNKYGYYFEPRAVPVNNQRQADYAAREVLRAQYRARIAARQAGVAS